MYQHEWAGNICSGGLSPAPLTPECLNSDENLGDGTLQSIHVIYLFREKHRKAQRCDNTQPVHYGVEWIIYISDKIQNYIILVFLVLSTMCGYARAVDGKSYKISDQV